jgi:two-component system, cell cycle response regulator DivK
VSARRYPAARVPIAVRPFWRSTVGLPSGVARRRQPVIVVADDDRDTRELYRACFEISGYRTAEAGTGAEALAMTVRLNADVLLTDLVFPDIDGLTVARQLRRIALTSGVRVILVTGYGSDDLARRALEAGVERALLKPCLPDAMLREVRRALRRGPVPTAPSALN